MIYLRRIFMVSAALVAIHIQGCGCDDDNDKYYPPPQTNYQVEGTTSKGLLRGFTVSAFSIADNGTVSSQPVASAVTDNSGVYTLNVPSTQGDRPLLIRVTPAASGSTMICDMSIGCGDVAFGGAIPIAADSGFTLSALIPSAASTEIANITVFSDIAAELALDDLPTTNAADIRDAIAAANSRVANRFGIVGNLTQLAVIDLTNNAAVTAAANNGNAALIRYAAMNAAIIAAVLSDNPTTSIAAGLRMFVDKYVEDGLAGNVSAETETGFGEILAFAQALLTIVQQSLGTGSPTNLAALIVDIEAEAQLANSEEQDAYDQGAVSQTAGASPLDKAKAMVEGLRDLAFSFGSTTVGNSTIGALSDDFLMQIEAAEMASSEDTMYLMEAMAMAASAVDDAYRARLANATLQSYTSDNGVVVAISTDNNAPVFSVNDSIEVMSDAAAIPVEVTLTARNAIALTDPEQETSAGMAADGEYEVVGSAQSATMVMQVENGSYVEVTHMASVAVVDQLSGSVTENHALEAFDLHLQVELSQRAAVDPVSLNGSLSVSLTDVALEEAATVTPQSTTEITEFNVGVVSFKFSGDISNSTGESVSFSLSISGDGTGVSLVETWVDGTNSLAAETEASYADLYGSLLFTAKLTGIPSVVTMNYGMTRTGLESVHNTLSIKYPGKQYRFNLAVEDGEPSGYLTIVNQDGVVMRARQVEVNGVTTTEGDVSYDGTVYGVIEQRDLGLVVTFPADGYVETFY